MKSSVLLSALAAAVCLTVGATKASAQVTNSVTLTSATGGQSKITFTGTYTLATGYTLDKITLWARTGNRTMSTAIAAAGGNFKGTLTIDAGTYDCWVEFVVTYEAQDPYTIPSDHIKGVKPWNAVAVTKALRGWKFAPSDLVDSRGSGGQSVAGVPKWRREQGVSTTLAP